MFCTHNQSIFVLLKAPIFVIVIAAVDWVKEKASPASEEEVQKGAKVLAVLKVIVHPVARVPSVTSPAVSVLPVVRAAPVPHKVTTGGSPSVPISPFTVRALCGDEVAMPIFPVERIWRRSTPFVPNTSGAALNVPIASAEGAEPENADVPIKPRSALLIPILVPLLIEPNIFWNTYP